MAASWRPFGWGLSTVIVMTSALSLSTCASRVENPDNQLPIGTVDTPAPNAILGPGPIVIGGWAADDSQVSEIRIFADGFFRTKTTVSVPRPDVARAFPAYHTTGDLFGWNVSLDFSFSPGAHTILVQAVDDSGATRDIGTVLVTMPR
jgi:hypothetical protein